MRITWLATAVSAIVLAFAVPAFASDYSFTSTSMNSPESVSIDGQGTLMAPMQFTDGIMTLEAWCLDVTHHIGVGGQSPPLEYDEDPLTTSTSLNGNLPFNAFQIGQFSYLINILAPSLGNIHQLNAVQGALWNISLGGVGHVLSGDSTIQSYIDGYTTLGLTSSRPLFAMESVGATSLVQDFAHGGAVPEPASWALMIIGFGAAGAMLRKRRQFALA